MSKSRGMPNWKRVEARMRNQAAERDALRRRLEKVQEVQKEMANSGDSVTVWWSERLLNVIAR